MKFALFILGSLMCCCQLALANGEVGFFSHIGTKLFQVDVMKCINDKEAAGAAISRQAFQNMMKICFNSENFSPATNAIVEDMKAKAAYCNQIITDLKNSTTLNEKFVNYGLAFRAYSALYYSITKFFNAPNADGSTEGQCVKTQMGPVMDAFKDILACFKF